VTDHKVEATFGPEHIGTAAAALQMTLNGLAMRIHQTAVEKGWWEKDRNMGEIMMNIASEVSEAWEAWREGHAMDEIYWNGNTPEGVPVEFADVIIRILDICAVSNIDIANAILLKMEYNATRPYRHGGKLA
jgi:NTP pyrophosphatase (non-canonical NTP hydrolase)